MSGPYSGPGNDPFQGGSLQRLNPPSGGTFGIPPPSGGGAGSLAGNVAGGAPFFARNNRGSNISIPYARVASIATFEPHVPLPGIGTALPRSTESLHVGTFLHEETRSTIEVLRETDELKKARLAWIMGRRSKHSESEEFLVQIGNQFGTEFGTIAEYYGGDRNTYWDAGKGVNRSSKLCSTEYLERLFMVAMRRVCIQLSIRYDFDEMGGYPTAYETDRDNQAHRDRLKAGDQKVGFFPHYSGGLLGTVSKPMKMEGNSSSKGILPDAVTHPAQIHALAAAVGAPQTPPNTAGIGAANFPYRNASHPMQVPLQRSASMTLTNNIIFDVSSRRLGPDRNPEGDSESVRSFDNRFAINNILDHQAPDRDFKCGIYPRSLSPFLHGRSLLQGASATLLQEEKGYPRRMPDALGDHVAFAALEQAMTRVGILDWRPDGVVNSKLENGPDEMADAMYDAKDGQLFNVHVQGPAICSNWCGTEHSRGLVAGDKLFVAIVADCWMNCGDKGSVNGAGVALDIVNKYAHLPAEMQTIYNTSGNPVVAGGDLDAASAKRRKILESFNNPSRGGGSKAQELHYSKLFGLQEMRAARRMPGGAPDYHSDITVNPHLLCNFRLKYVTSSQMIETSKLALTDEGAVEMGPNGAWLTGSRLGLAISKSQLRNNVMYEPDKDMWIDPEKTVTAARNAAGLGNEDAAENEVKTAMRLYHAHIDAAEALVAARNLDRDPLGGGAASPADVVRDGDRTAADLEIIALPPPAPAIRALATRRGEYGTAQDDLTLDANAAGAAVAAAAAAFITVMRKYIRIYDAREAVTIAFDSARTNFPGVGVADADIILAQSQHFRGPPAGAALHEVVVGAWHVGTVLDTAASRGAGRGLFASHKYDSAVNVNVDVQWWSGDRLFKHYANKPGTGQEFRMRSLPVMGYTTNHSDNKDKPAVFAARDEVHVDGTKTDVGGIGQNAVVDYINKHTSPVVGYAGNYPPAPRPDGTDKTVLEVRADALGTMKARTTFPDPWDLPAAVKMLPAQNAAASSIYNQRRDAYVGVGQQRGDWDNKDDDGTAGLPGLVVPAIAGGTIRVGRNEMGVVDGSHPGSNVMDPGNKFASGTLAIMRGTEFANNAAATLRQGAIVAHTSY